METPITQSELIEAIREDAMPYHHLASLILVNILKQSNAERFQVILDDKDGQPLYGIFACTTANDINAIKELLNVDQESEESEELEPDEFIAALNETESIKSFSFTQNLKP